MLQGVGQGEATLHLGRPGTCGQQVLSAGSGECGERGALCLTGVRVKWAALWPTWGDCRDAVKLCRGKGVALLCVPEEGGVEWRAEGHSVGKYCHSEDPCGWIVEVLWGHGPARACWDGTWAAGVLSVPGPPC